MSFGIILSTTDVKETFFNDEKSMMVDLNAIAAMSRVPSSSDSMIFVVKASKVENRRACPRWHANKAIHLTTRF